MSTPFDSELPSPDSSHTGLGAGLIGASKYKWNSLTRSYIPLRGSPIDTEALRSIVADIRFKASSKLATLGTSISSGTLTNTAQFAVEFKTELKNLYVSTHILARGGVSQMDQKAWGKLGAALKQQYAHANMLILDIENQRIPLGEGLLRRVDLYTNSAWGAQGEFENVVRDRELALGSLEQRVLGPSKENCAGCISVSYKWMASGLLPDIGDMECGPGCNCRFEFKNP